MESKYNVKIGQVWKRKDGRLVKLTESRVSRGSLEFKLYPVGSGRTSWKWDGGIVNNLTLVEDVE